MKTTNAIIKLSIANKKKVTYHSKFSYSTIKLETKNPVIFPTLEVAPHNPI